MGHPSVYDMSLSHPTFERIEATGDFGDHAAPHRVALHELPGLVGFQIADRLQFGVENPAFAGLPQSAHERVQGQEQFQVTDNAVTFHVRASDADGDPLIYSLKDAPAGMSIDRKTGWVRWVTSPGTPGKVPFTVIVSDGSGGESAARFTVTVAEQPSSGAR